MSDRKKLDRNCWIALAIVLIGICLGLFIQNTFGFLLGLSVIIGGLYYNYKTVVCPHCGESLMGMRFIPDYCPHCGKRIE